MLLSACGRSALKDVMGPAARPRYKGIRQHIPIAGKQTIELGVKLDIAGSIFRNRAGAVGQFNGGLVRAGAVSRLKRDQDRGVEVLPLVQNNTTINGEGWGGGGGWTPPWRKWDMNSTLCDCDLGKDSECDSCPLVIAVDLPI